MKDFLNHNKNTFEMLALEHLKKIKSSNSEYSVTNWFYVIIIEFLLYQIDTVLEILLIKLTKMLYEGNPF